MLTGGLYVSAALVLVGEFLLSRGLAVTGGQVAELWFTGVTELYQGLLLGSAALLYRLGLRRPAVLLALLAAVYLGDLTLQTGISPLLGTVGVVASLVWFARFQWGGGDQLAPGSGGQAWPAAFNVIRVISEVLPRRMGGPQNPVPSLT